MSIFAAIGSFQPSAAPIVFPADIGPNVKSLYNVKGDNATDDLAAIRTALADGRNEANLITDQAYYAPRPKFLYFPAGTYLLSDTLRLIGQGFTIQGQGVGSTVFRIKNASTRFSSASTPHALFNTMNGNSCFRINFHDLTINTGTGNPGAIGLRWTANNVGTVENVEIVSGDRQGSIGLDMTAAWPGPCFVKNLRVEGFDYGIRTAHHEYGVTFQNITLRNQRVAGFHNNLNTVCIDGLISSNTVPVVINTYPDPNWNPGLFTLINGQFTGGSSTVSAIESDCDVYLRSIDASSSIYRSVVRSKTAVVAGRSVKEFVSRAVAKLWTESPDTSLNLPVKRSPEFHDNNLANWGKHQYNSDGSGSTNPATLDALFHSGKTTIYFSGGSGVLLGQTINVPATVKRIIGFNAHINEWGNGGLILRITENSPDPLIIERLTNAVRVVHASNRTVVVRHGEFRFTDSIGTGDWYIEDCVLGDFTLRNKRNVWARQFNVETWYDPHTRITNSGGGNLWIMGMKTEGFGPIISTTNGSGTELLGGLLYGHDMPDTEFVKPAFTIVNSRASLSFNYSSYGTVLADGTDKAMFQTMIRETRGTVVREIPTRQIAQKIVPLFTGFAQSSPVIMPAQNRTITGQHSPKKMLVVNGRRLPLPSKAMALYSLKGELLSHGDNRVGAPDAGSRRRSGIVVVRYLSL